MQKLTLRHLRYFDSLARNRHFGRAAEACAISQPALSLQMKELETLIGAPLIERGPRQVRLTALGEALVARARDILRAVDDLGDLARVAVSGLSGELRLGVIPTIAPYLLPYVITTLAERFEKLELRPQEAITSRLVDDLLSGTLDAAIVALPVSEPGLHEHPLFEEEFVLVRPLADADKPVPDPADLHEMRLLLLGEGHSQMAGRSPPAPAAAPAAAAVPKRLASLALRADHREADQPQPGGDLGPSPPASAIAGVAASSSSAGLAMKPSGTMNSPTPSRIALPATGSQGVWAIRRR
jgi:DNA-binding transcriptional LysR family regulator